jgi:hypothetical protein
LVPDLLSQRKALEKQLKELGDEYMDKGFTKVTENPVESAVEANQISRELQTEEAALSKLEGLMGGVDADPDLTPSLFPEGATARQSIPPGNVARNMADVAAIKSGNAAGDPAPIVTDSMIRNFFKAEGPDREVVVNIAEASRKTGEFNAYVNGFRYTKADMSDAAWKVYLMVVRFAT